MDGSRPRVRAHCHAGRYGGTYAHKDIAFEFGSWLSPEFKLYLIKEFERLKDDENRRLSLSWNLNRALSKLNYRIHTDAIKQHLIPPEITPAQAAITYANEADLLNVALFGARRSNGGRPTPGLTATCRDHATIEQLLVLANLEGMNAEFIHMSLPQGERLKRLNQIAIRQMLTLTGDPALRNFRPERETRHERPRSQIRDALRHELSWTHYRLLLRVENPQARGFYEAEAVNANWSTRELERQIHSLAICPRKRNWRPKCSASGKPSRWKADFGRKRPMNNPQRFPSDLRFPLSDEEFENWRSQIVTSNSAARMGLRRRPNAFTEQGVAMLSSVLNSDRAVEVNMAIMRAFVRLREIMSTHFASGGTMKGVCCLRFGGKSN